MKQAVFESGWYGGSKYTKSPRFAVRTICSKSACISVTFLSMLAELQEALVRWKAEPGMLAERDIVVSFPVHPPEAVVTVLVEVHEKCGPVNRALPCANQCIELGLELPEGFIIISELLIRQGADKSFRVLLHDTVEVDKFRVLVTDNRSVKPARYWRVQPAAPRPR